MKNLIFLFGLLSIFGQDFYAQNYKVTTQNSTVTYLGKKPLGSHKGLIPISKGSLKITNEKITGDFIFDMNGVTCIDLKNEEQNGYFIQHLKSEDFFDVKKHPTAKFIITSAKKIEKEQYAINGKLTLKAITKTVTFFANVKITPSEITLKTSDYFYINRTEWGVKYKSKTFFANLKDKFIDDKVGIKINITAYK